MKKNNIVKNIFLITIFLITIDQITKFVIQYKYSNRIIGSSIIKIELINNDGIAFGLNSGNTKNIILTVFILALIFRFIKTQKNRIDFKTSIALSLILSGGISNLIDRIFKGAVVDFIKIEKFAIFNIADCYIVVGWMLMIIFLIIFNKNLAEVKHCKKE